MMSVSLNNSDFQCLQDQLVDLKTKNYELAEKNRRCQADFEAAKAKICTLQLKLEEQERDFQITSATLRREIEAVTEVANRSEIESSSASNKNDEDDYKMKYKKLKSKAKELQQRYEKSNEVLNERVRKLEEENEKLKEEIVAEQKKSQILSVNQTLSDENDEKQNHLANLEVITSERDELLKKVNNFDHRLESEAEERKIHERKALQLVKELKRQLAQEKNRAETLQKRLESLLSEPPVTATVNDIESRSRLSTSSSTNGSRANQDANSVGSWSFVPVKTTAISSNPALNETLSLCSIDSEDRETVQQPCDTVSEDLSNVRCGCSTESGFSRQNLTSTTDSSPVKQELLKSPALKLEDKSEQKPEYQKSPTYNQYVQGACDGILIEEQAVLVDRLTKLQHANWMLEEKLSYMEQANSSLSEDLANKSDIIKHYFINQAIKSSNMCDGATSCNSSSPNVNSNSSSSSRRTSIPNNFNQLLLDKPSLKKVVDFLKDKSQISSDSDSISREATKKMQLMLEETLIKCLKLQENLDHVTSELNKLRC